MVDSVHKQGRRSLMTAAMTPLLERNDQFARAYSPVPLGLPAARVMVLTCVDHRVDPAITLGLKLGDAPVLRNAGGRVTESVIGEIAYLAFLGRRLFSVQLTEDRRFEVAVIHHTQCGTGFLADPAFRQEAAEATRTLPSSPTSTACSPRPCSRRWWASPVTCTTSRPGESPRWSTPGTPSRLGQSNPAGQ